MTGRLLRAALLLAALPAAAGAVAVALKAGHRQLHVDRHRFDLAPQPRRSCLYCQGDGDWGVDGVNPEMEACGCWANRPTWRLRLLPVRAAWPDEPPF
ncbi:hypothetical protein [Streptomyces fradiae]|uniref:hypothetical protein n=1 Tax=Streptomyces fradiae TaxID=1906 RepID=UPI003988364C